MEYTNYNLGHDEWDNTTQVLRKWLWARNPKLGWRMPLSFGPSVGPRQDSQGRFLENSYMSSVTASIKFKTSRTLLQNMLPTSAFAFGSPSTIAYATLSCTSLNDLAWLGGGGYNHMGLYIHDVQYTQQDGSLVKGSFLAVLFENLTDPILTGREELGMPKIFSDINVDRRDDSLTISLEWRGVQFGKFEWEGLEASSTSASATADATPPNGNRSAEPDMHESRSEDGILTYRYIPAVGELGKADAEYAVFIPHGKPTSGAPVPQKQVMQSTKARFSFAPHDWSALPTLHNVSGRLAEMPVYNIEEAKVVETNGVVNALHPIRLK
jgi:hypothetical protein